MTSPLPMAPEEDPTADGPAETRRGNVLPVPNGWVSSALQVTDILTLLRQKIDIAYKIGTMYTACATGYVAVVGFGMRTALESLATRHDLAVGIARVGVILAALSVAGGFGLLAVTRVLEDEIRGYRDSLGIQRAEGILILKVGAWLSIGLFVTIGGVWSWIAIS